MLVWTKIWVLSSNLESAPPIYQSVLQESFERLGVLFPRKSKNSLAGVIDLFN